VTDPAQPHVLGGSATDEETAAIAAVFAQLLVERAAAPEPLPPGRSRSAWERGMRPVRLPLEGPWQGG
jgi:hypothetical protein